MRPRLIRTVFPLLFGAMVIAAPGLAATAQTTNLCAGTPPSAGAPTAGGVASTPLTVGADSHVVVMEYEAWFGPHAVGFQPEVTLCLQSPDMAPAGGGYDSADPMVLARHAQWLRLMGVDAVTADLTNNVSCIFDGDNPAIVEKACPDASFRAQQLSIRDNTGALYPAWSALGTSLKIIPMLGGFDPDAVTPDGNDSRHRTALEKEAGFFGGLMARFGAMNVIYQGKPLMLIYTGTPADPARVQAIRNLLRSTGLDHRYTFRLIAGYLESQPSFWAHPEAKPAGPIEVSPRNRLWSFVDRIGGAPAEPYFPTYSPAAGRVETLTVSIATAGRNGWSCATRPGQSSFCPDAALRHGGEAYRNGRQPGRYETLAQFMTYARALKPTFLIIHQFNEFAQSDEGWNAETNDDAEPTREWGYSAMRAVIDEMTRYRTAVTPR